MPQQPAAVLVPEVVSDQNTNPVSPARPHQASALSIVKDGAGASQQLAVLPILSGDEMIAAFDAYVDIQKRLDKAMPDAIIEIDGKSFRKKNYWRAISMTFGLNVEPIPGTERREDAGTFDDGRPNFGYLVEYRATHARSGRSATGDGACFAIEKAARFKCSHEDPNKPGWKLHFPVESCPDFDASYQWRALPPHASEHNIRSHAHTRAFNRAVSNLVGFGEVSAEEVGNDERDPRVVYESQAPRDGKLYVVDVGKTKGHNARGEWTRYDVKFSDGRCASTFNEKVADGAAKFASEGTSVDPTLEQKGKYLNVIAIREAKLKPVALETAVAEKAAVAETPTEPDLKELVVGVRSINRPDATPLYGIKATSGRPECYTDDEALAGKVEATIAAGKPVILRTVAKPGVEMKMPGKHAEQAYRWLVELVIVGVGA